MAPLLFAHRGASRELPENTLPAFVRAVEIGVDYLETDAHVTRDGQVVLAHDASGLRMAGEPCFIHERTLGQVQRWDAGRNFIDPSGRQPFSGQGFRVPTLAEALAELPDVRFNVDIKPNDLRAADAVLRVIDHARAGHRVRLASFHTRVLSHVRASGYPGGTSLGPTECAWLAMAPGRLQRRPGDGGRAAQIPLRIGPVAADTRPFIEHCHGLGIAVHFWTINDPDEARRLLALGADGIMTDDPRAVGPAVRGWTSA